MVAKQNLSEKTFCIFEWKLFRDTWFNPLVPITQLSMERASYQYRAKKFSREYRSNSQNSCHIAYNITDTGHILIISKLNVLKIAMVILKANTDTNLTYEVMVCTAHWGLIWQIHLTCFFRLQRQINGVMCRTWCVMRSMVEIYNEQVQDKPLIQSHGG